MGGRTLALLNAFLTSSREVSWAETARRAAKRVATESVKRMLVELLVELLCSGVAGRQE